MPFAPGSEVVVRQTGHEDWELVEPLTYLGKTDTFEVPAGQATDFASVPRIFVWFLPRYGSYTKAAILHDHLWREHAAAGEMSWIDADAIFRRALRELEVPFLRRWIMWTAVRWAALPKPRGREGWWREAWRVLLVTLVAIPFLVPPALVVAVCLVAFWVLEWVLWLPIQLLAALRRRSGRPARKEVNAPALGWETSS
jgi:hypothetical protein